MSHGCTAHRYTVAQMRQGGDCEAHIKQNPYDYSLRAGRDRVLFVEGEEPRRRTAQYRSHCAKEVGLVETADGSRRYGSCEEAAPGFMQGKRQNRTKIRCLSHCATIEATETN